YLTVGSVIRNAIAAFGGTNDNTAALDDLGRGRHPFDGLVEILIERVSRVRRYDDVKWPIDASHNTPARELASCGMFLKQVTRKSSCDLLIAIQRDIKSEIDPSHARDFAHVVVHRITLRDSPCRLWMSDAFGIVEGHHRVEPG